MGIGDPDVFKMVGCKNALKSQVTGRLRFQIAI